MWGVLEAVTAGRAADCEGKRVETATEPGAGRSMATESSLQSWAAVPESGWEARFSALR
ncbi:hypothetical protein D3C87_1850040 [compost metagenome]